jgi:hypothetical protein
MLWTGLVWLRLEIGGALVNAVINSRMILNYEKLLSVLTTSRIVLSSIVLVS